MAAPHPIKKKERKEALRGSIRNPLLRCTANLPTPSFLCAVMFRLGSSTLNTTDYNTGHQGIMVGLGQRFFPKVAAAKGYGIKENSENARSCWGQQYIKQFEGRAELARAVRSSESHCSGVPERLRATASARSGPRKKRRLLS